VAPSAAKKVRIAWSRLQPRTYGRASTLGGSALGRIDQLLELLIALHFSNSNPPFTFRGTL
jgi:hypothetical protein